MRAHVLTLTSINMHTKYARTCACTHTHTHTHTHTNTHRSTHTHPHSMLALARIHTHRRISNQLYTHDKISTDVTFLSLISALSCCLHNKIIFHNSRSVIRYMANFFLGHCNDIWHINTWSFHLRYRIMQLFKLDILK